MKPIRKTGIDLTANVNDITICYDDLGPDNDPIIFIHGFPFDKSSWEPQTDHLKSTRRVIAYDIRGFGKSGRGNQTLSMDLFANDLKHLLAYLQIDQVVAVGLSMGGYILMNALNKYPELFEGLVFCDTQCIADSKEGKEKRMKTIEQIKTNGLDEFAKGFINNIFSKDSIQNKTAMVDKIKNCILSTPQDTITDTLIALAERPDMCSSLSKISVPTMILCGEEDVVTPLSQSEFMLKSIKHAVLKSIPNAGHMSNLEQPNLFNQFLEMHVPAMTKS
ncbi:MAG: alpha/beta hydrolase [Bacteroidia bacterium]|nr:alpha/beta hydrolase [Bacteroidia bacterium]